MTLEDFVTKFAEEFDETPIEQFTATTKFKDLEEWGSLTALSIIAMVDEEFDKRITGADIRESDTIEDLYNKIIAK
ncbi:MAG: phosphopantetheine-binding protein [Bacteroidales bacterium]|jgi:acyl carrier protein|nr:phosphopantetheine-binding protein [Bacteroidales bacterium]